MPEKPLQPEPNHSLSGNLRQQAQSVGFDLVGICAAVAPPGLARLHEWLARGFAGEMHYFRDRFDAYAHPRHVLQNVRSIVMLSTPYSAMQLQPARHGVGNVARYALGDADYHDVIHVRLKVLCDWIQQHSPDSDCRGVVDTAPLMEHEFAQLAGLGWIGKNTLLLNRKRGSYFFLSALLTSVELDYDAAHATDHCGTCTACLDACPTDAFPQPYVLDATKCISYLTIENRGPIPNALRGSIGDWVWGCDICQEVCPWNHHADNQTSAPFAEDPSFNPLDLVELFSLDEIEFRKRFRHTPLWRAKRRGLLRNAAIVLGNQRATHAEAALICGLNDAEPLVRGTCAWALGQLQTPTASKALEIRTAVEPDPTVVEEIHHALA